MKRFIFASVVIALLTGNVHKAQAQANGNSIYVLPEALNETPSKGIHLEVESFFSPFNTYSVKRSGNSSGQIYGNLENVNTFAINAALVYQFNGVFYLGGGTGFIRGQLHWATGTESESTNSFVLPVYARAGICDAVSRKISFFFNAYLGVGIGLSKAKTAFYFTPQVGIYYGTTKIALGGIFFKPDCEYFFNENLNNEYGGGFGLTMGFRM